MILSVALILPVSQLQAASDDVANEVTHIIFNTDLLYFCAHFIVEIGENLAIMAGLIRFNND